MAITQDALTEMQDLRSAYKENCAIYWAITAIISCLIGVDHEYAVQQMRRELTRAQDDPAADRQLRAA